MSVLHLAAIRTGVGRNARVCVCVYVSVPECARTRWEVILCSRDDRLRGCLAGGGTGVPSFWLPPCVPVVSSAPVSPSPIYDDQNTLLTAECSAFHSALPQPLNVP